MDFNAKYEKENEELFDENKQLRAKIRRLEAEINQVSSIGKTLELHRKISDLNHENECLCKSLDLLFTEHILSVLKEACEKEQKKTAELTVQLKEKDAEIKELKKTASRCIFCEGTLRVNRANEKIRELKDENLMFKCQLRDAHREIEWLKNRRWWEFW